MSVVGAKPVDPYYYSLEFSETTRATAAVAGEITVYSVVEERAAENRLSVFARVSDLVRWRALPGVQPGTTEVACETDWIVTADIRATDFIQFNDLPFVQTLQVSRPVEPFLAKTVEDVGLRSGPRISQQMLDQGGKGVVVGIIDDGCDFAHNHFIKPLKPGKPSRRTRIHSIEVQTRMGNSYSYRIITRKEINQALQVKDSYSYLGYFPKQRAHGTHVMDIAAGNGPSSGLAPKSKIVFVDYCRTDVASLDAAGRIFDLAGDRPCVINMSFGTNSGPHDGKTIFEVGVDELLSKKPNRAIVISAGNSYVDNVHHSGVVADGKSVDVPWGVKVTPSPSGYGLDARFLEIWYSKMDELKIDVWHPDGTLLLNKVPLKTEKEDLMIKRSGVPISAGYVSHTVGSKDGDRRFFLFHNVINSVEDNGIWTLKLHGTSIKSDGKFHAWIRDGRSSIFIHDNPLYTLNAMASGHKTIAVGSYDAFRSGSPNSYFSSSGPTRDGRFKPEVSAPGHNVWAANSTTENGVIPISGTSMAAPAATGLVARLLGQARLRGLALTVDQIRDFVISTSRKTPPSAPFFGQDSKGNWDLRYGYGRIHADAILLQSNPPSPAAAPIAQSVPPAGGGGGTPPASQPQQPHRGRHGRGRGHCHPSGHHHHHHCHKKHH